MLSRPGQRCRTDGHRGYFPPAEFVPEIVEAAIRIGARAVWMQEGVVHEEAAQKAAAAGLTVVMDRCILKDHRLITFG